MNNYVFWSRELYDHFIVTADSKPIADEIAEFLYPDSVEAGDRISDPDFEDMVSDIDLETDWQYRRLDRYFQGVDDIGMYDEDED